PAGGHQASACTRQGGTGPLGSTGSRATLVGAQRTARGGAALSRPDRTTLGRCAGQVAGCGRGLMSSSPPSPLGHSQSTISRSLVLDEELVLEMPSGQLWVVEGERGLAPK